VQIARGGAQCFEEDAVHLLGWEWWHAIEQRQQRVAILARQGVDLQGEDLAELDEAAAQLFKNLAQEIGSLCGSSAQPAVAVTGQRRGQRSGDFEHPAEVGQDRQTPLHVDRSSNTGVGGAAPFITLPQKMLLRFGSISSMLRCTMF